MLHEAIGLLLSDLKSALSKECKKVILSSLISFSALEAGVLSDFRQISMFIHFGEYIFIVITTNINVC